MYASIGGAVARMDCVKSLIFLLKGIGIANDFSFASAGDIKNLEMQMLFRGGDLKM